MKRNEPKFSVDLKAGDMTEIFVVGDGYRLLDQGVGSLKTELPRGRYVVKYRKGAETSQKAIRVSENMQLSLEDTDPLYGVAASSTRMPDDAASWAYDEMQLGVGGNLLILLEDQETDLSSGSRVTLLDPNLQEVPLLEQGAGNRMVLRDHLPPGYYFLCGDIAHMGAVSLALEVFDGFQTQVYVRRMGASRDSTERQPDLANVQISMMSHEVGMSREEFVNGWEATQTAAQALAYMRPTPPESILEHHLYEKFRNPLLGLLGAHLLLTSGNPREGLVADVLNNLKSILPDSPEVVALQVLARQKWPRSTMIPPVTLLPISFPPLLKVTWDVFLQEDHSRPEGLFETGSIAERVQAVSSAPTPWFLWGVAEEERTSVSVDPGVIERIRSYDRVPSKGVAVQRLVKGLSESAPVEQNIGEIAQGLRIPRQQVPAYLMELESELAEEE